MLFKRRTLLSLSSTYLHKKVVNQLHPNHLGSHQIFKAASEAPPPSCMFAKSWSDIPMSTVDYILRYLLRYLGDL